MLACVVSGCNGAGTSDRCRFEPETCLGGIGAFCDDDLDCGYGVCCTSGNCGGGMCTYECDSRHPCPSGMACEHNTCFYACSDDLDCAPQMSCEHGQTVCEWP